MKLVLVDMPEEFKEVVFIDCIYVNRKYYEERRDIGWQPDILKAEAEENTCLSLTMGKTPEQGSVPEKVKCLKDVSEMPEKY